MNDVETAITAALPKRRVFDCFLFNGETDVLAIRFHELNEVVDHFVIVESNSTFSGMPRQINFDPCHPSVAPFAAKVRHVVVADMPQTSDPWVREAWQRNAVLRGIPDAAPTDLVIISDADEIPRSTSVADMVRDNDNESFGFRLAFHYFYVNYRNVVGPEANLTWTVAATRRQLDRVTPDALRYGVRDGKIPAKLFDHGGWHFSYMMDEAGIRKKIAAFSHQEYNNEVFLERINIAAMLRDGRDLFNRPGFVWKLLPDTDLPDWLRQNHSRLQHMFHPINFAEQLKARLSRWTKFATAARKPAPPVVICPYLYDNEQAEIRSKFHLDGAAGQRMEFFFWQDKERIGPEFAFEHCWGQFPDRDIIIVHSDMAPMPGESPSQWYDALCGFRETLPHAGMLACNLFHPTLQNAPVSVQCAGGILTNGQVDYLHGPLNETPGGQGMTRAMLGSVRPVDWETFGGVLIRREVIRACDPFDRRYQWAYVMDVDYSFEARLRGFRLLQVPVSLQHEENRTTRRLWEQSPELKDHIGQNMDRFYAKWARFQAALPSETMIAGTPAPAVIAS